MVSGRVLNTATGIGIAGVCVSDGEHVVLTDECGEYHLDAMPTSHPFIVVTAPSGYRPAPTSWVPTAQASTAGCDFLLEPAPERAAGSFSFAQITDLHVEAESPKLTSRQTLAADLATLVEQAGPAFIVASGDLTQTGAVDQLEACRDGLYSTSVPVFPMFGGHDGNSERYAGDGDGAATYARNYERVLGPVGRSIIWGDLHVVFLTNEEMLFLSAQDRMRLVAWLSTILRVHRDMPLVVVTHEPPTIAWLDQFAGYDLRLVLHGHCHTATTHTWRGITVAGTPPLTFGGCDRSPRGYRLITWDRGSLRHELRPLQSLRRAVAASNSAVRWERRISDIAIHAQPVVCGDAVLLSRAGESDLGGGGIIALAALDGSTQWDLDLGDGVRGEAARGDDTGAAQAAPGVLAAFDVATGVPRWRTELPGYPRRRILSSPLVSGDLVIAGEHFGYSAHDADTGRLRWLTRLEWRDGGSQYYQPIEFAGLIIAPDSRTAVVAMCREDGTVVWRTPVTQHHASTGPVDVGDGAFVVGHTPGEIASHSARDGRELWRRSLGEDAYLTAVEVYGSTIMAVLSTGAVQCRERSTGELRWTYRFGPDIVDMSPYTRGGSSASAKPVVIGDNVVAAGFDGVIVTISAADGSERARLDVGSPVTGLAAYSRGVIVVMADRSVVLVGVAA